MTGFSRPRGGTAGVLRGAKARAVTLKVPRTAPEDSSRLSAAKQASLEVTLADGSHLSGWATLELPQHHSRLLDYFNPVARPFFSIATADEGHVITRSHVLYVRPED